MRTEPLCCGWSDAGSPGSRPRSFCTCQVLRPRRAVQTLVLARRTYCPPPSQQRRRPECESLRGSMADLCIPLPTLRCRPCGRPRTTQGRCGSLLLPPQTIDVIDPKTGDVRQAQIFVAVRGGLCQANWREATPFERSPATHDTTTGVCLVLRRVDGLDPQALFVVLPPRICPKLSDDERVHQLLVSFLLTMFSRREIGLEYQ